MRLFSLLFVTLFAFATGHSQVLDPVKWSYKAVPVDDDKYDLVFTAKIDQGWSVYSQFIEEGGPVPTAFYFDEGEHYKAEGRVEESDNVKTTFDPIFEMKLSKFQKSAVFTQRVVVSDFSKKITGSFEFMTCDDERCLPPKYVDFDFKLDAGGTDMEFGEIDLSDENEETGDGILNPVKWSFETKDKGNNTFDLVVTGDIDQGWFVYSQNLEEGPIPTTFYFDEVEGLTLEGTTSESGTEKYEGYDPIFQIDVVKYKKRVEFTQTVVADPAIAVVTGEFEFMTCDDERCLPPKYVSFSFVLNEALAVGQGLTAMDGVDPEEGFNVIDQTVPALMASYEEPVGECSQREEKGDKSLLWTFVLGFAGGLLALLTPCVFPMIPLTVSFFSKDSNRKGWMNGAIYGASIIVIYVLLGLLVTMMFGAEALNELSTNWIANTLFFIIFIVFAFSFFGFYEIQLPASWANKSDKMADKGGLIGIFFMAFTLALVSFSCTGPIIGSAIVQSASNPVGPFVVMLGFSAALALPFGLFAAFPAWLNSLPKSGGWMNSVKVILGFLELALAFKFLSVADMTSHWGFLRYELFVGIWVIVAIAMALYLFGIIRFPHDPPKAKRSIPRLTMAVACTGLAVYMATGFMYNDRSKTYNALPMLSGLAPPAHYNFFQPVPEPDAEIKSRYASFSKCANNLDCFKDYHEGVAYAKEVNKPVFLDFTGYGCVNCRKTEEHIWVKDEVWSKLKNDFVMISLYVDDREPLNEIVISKSRGEKLRNIGNKWADFQIVNFEQNSQPLYVIMSPEEQVLATPRGYKEGVKDYADYLECALNTFNDVNNQLGELQ